MYENRKRRRITTTEKEGKKDGQNIPGGQKSRGKEATALWEAHLSRIHN